MNRKKAICERCGQEKYIYARGRCNMCYWVENYKKNMKRRQDRANTSWGFNNEAEMFAAIWNERKHVSFLSGRKLSVKEGCSFWFSQFSHVLNKKNYPQYRLNPENLILLTIEEHILFDNGTEKQRKEYAEKHKCNWSVIFDLREKFKMEYKEKYLAK